MACTAYGIKFVYKTLEPFYALKLGAYLYSGEKIELEMVSGYPVYKNGSFVFKARVSKENSEKIQYVFTHDNVGNICISELGPSTIIRDEKETYGILTSTLSLG